MDKTKIKSAYCRKCGAWCCRWLVVDWQPYTGLENEELFFALRGIKLDKENKKLLIPLRCRWLTEHNSCRIYARRPKSCSTYECDKLKAIGSLLKHEKT